MQFDPPNPPFSNPSWRDSAGSTLQGSLASPLSSPSRSRNGTPLPLEPPGMATADSNASLAVNYIPSKFSNPQLSPVGPRRRKTTGKGKRNMDPGVPKMGGGVDAFRTGEARIGGPVDEDEDESRRNWFARQNSKHSGKARWNGFKWVLFCANLMLTIYSFVALVFCLLTWFNVWKHADIIRVANQPELVVSTLAASAGIITCLIGWVGILMNNRSFLAIYTLLLWIVFIFILVPGYLTYKRRTFNLEGKINLQWSRDLGEEGRLRIQNQLQCCGYFSPFVEATVSPICYSRTILPGCKLSYLAFERRILKVWYSVAFVLVPFHLMVIIAGLLCSNHVTYRFGKGMMPKAYRLSMTSMAIIMDSYANQLAEHYGEEIATDVLTRSRSSLLLDVMPAMPFAPSAKTPMRPPYNGTKYDSLSTKPPPAENAALL